MHPTRARPPRQAAGAVGRSIPSGFEQPTRRKFTLCKAQAQDRASLHFVVVIKRSFAPTTPPATLLARVAHRSTRLSHPAPAVRPSAGGPGYWTTANGYGRRPHPAVPPAPAPAAAPAATSSTTMYSSSSTQLATDTILRIPVSIKRLGCSARC